MSSSAPTSKAKVIVSPRFIEGGVKKLIEPTGADEFATLCNDIVYNVFGLALAFVLTCAVSCK